ncbi:MAG TPA: methionine--tRNA ligase, partial [Micromonosporaceae bacterium]
MSYYLASVAWPYANGPRHIGHVSGFGIPSDVFSRYMRMAGHDVLMVSGTDEHGTPILVEAEKEGVTPRELADRYNRVIAEDLVALGLSYDLFTRTTTRNHYAVAQELFRTVHGNGYLLKETTRGAISPSTGRTLPDRYIEGTCPICGFDGARGDQCDNCGNQLDPVDLINPRSRVNGEVPEFVETEHFFLDLPKLSTALGEWLKTRTDWRPNVLKFSLNLLEDIRPRAMTRDIDWGIPVPLPGWEENPNKRLYVWFDAVVGYLSASIEWARRFGAGDGSDPQAWRHWWQQPESGDGAEAPRSYYFMGKDNITFHAQIWPAELLAYNGEGDNGGEPGPLGRLCLPTEVVSSEYLTMEGRKFSSSRRVVIYVRDFLARYDADALRYFVAVAGPETTDTDFTWSEFLRRNNDELVAGWGNLVNRSISMAAKNFSAIPAAGEFTAEDRALLDSARAAFGTVGGLIERHRMKAAINEAMRVVGEANKYLS